jgi:hypothetical protein
LQIPLKDRIEGESRPKENSSISTFYIETHNLFEWEEVVQIMCDWDIMETYPKYIGVC